MRLAQRPIIPQKGRGMFGKIRRFGSTALQKLKDAARTGNELYKALPANVQNAIKVQAKNAINSGYNKFSDKLDSSTTLPKSVVSVLGTASEIARDHALGRLNQI